MERTSIDASGRVLVPAALRRQLSLRAGTELVATAEDGRLVLQTRDAAWQRLRQLFSSAAPDGSVVEELGRDRRREGRRESAA